MGIQRHALEFSTGGNINPLELVFCSHSFCYLGVLQRTERVGYGCGSLVLSHFRELLPRLKSLKPTQTQNNLRFADLQWILGLDIVNAKN